MFNGGTSGLTASDVLALTNNDGGFGGNGSWLWILVIFALLFGWGGNGFGGYGGSGAMENYVLTSDFSQLSRQISEGFGSQERKLDSISNGICSLGYDQLAQMNGINTNILQSANGIQTQLADCCCKTQQNIKDTQYAIATTGAGITNAIKDCCCDTEKQFMQTRYDNAQANCATLQAISDSTKQIIDYLNAEKAQSLRDENQALRLSASQQCQNNYLISQLRPTPIPSFNVGYNPYNYGFGFGYGTTIA